MALLSIQRIPRNGSTTAITFATADAGGTDDVPGVPGVVILADNAGGGAEVITMVAVPCSHGRSVNEAPSIGAGAQGALNATDPALWKQSDGNIDITHSGAATLGFAAVVFE